MKDHLVLLPAAFGLGAIVFVMFAAWRRPCRLLLLMTAVSLSAFGAYAQKWSGIIAPSRAVDWSQAGVVGGIPSGSWTQCGSTISAGASASTIQSAINSCAANHYVLLGPGTFNLTTGLNLKSNVVLRGSGSSSTNLVFTGGVGCYSGSATICITGDPSTYSNSTNPNTGRPGGTNAANWTAGYSQGATSITVTNVGSAGITNGQYIYIAQANDTSPTSTMFVCDTTSCSTEGGSPGQSIGGVTYSQLQVVKVTAGCSSSCSGSGPFTLTISPGLYGPNWTSSKNPIAWWPLTMMQYAGVENLSINAQNSGTLETIGIFNASNSWVSGVKSLYGNRAHVWIIQGAHNQVQNSYFYQTQNGASQSYGIEEDLASDNLVVNNIMQQVTAPLMGGSQFGNTFAYNYGINHYQTQSATCMYPAEITHDAGANYNLWEGNFFENIEGDAVHGTGGLNTAYRNVFTGYELGKSCTAISVFFDPYNRAENVIGNVLGTPGKTATYQNDPNQQFAVYALGQPHANIGADSLVASTILRWGNYDNVTGAVRWCGNSSNTGWSSACGSKSEVPTGLSSYPNSVPSYGDTGAGQSAMPASFVYNSTPSWWPSGKPWPPIGPDVTNGNIGQCSGGTYASLFGTSSGQCTGGSFSAQVNGGHAHSNPAMDCYFSLHGPPDGSGSALAFDAASCYTTSGSSSGSGPGSPTGLTATVN